MESREEPDGTLVVTYDSTRLWKWLGAGAVALLATGVYDLTIGSRGDERLVGLVGAGTTCLLMALVLREDSRFVFDPAARTIGWTRLWGWKRRSGSLSFDDVTGVDAETPIGDSGIPSRRICLRLGGKGEQPLTAGYMPDHGDEMLRLASRLHQLVRTPKRLDVLRSIAGQIGRLAVSQARAETVEEQFDDEFIET